MQHDNQPINNAQDPCKNDDTTARFIMILPLLISIFMTFLVVFVMTIY